MSYIKEVFGDIKNLESPNMIKTIVLGSDFLYMRAHGAESEDETYLMPYDEALLGEDNVLFFLEDRQFGCLEDLVVVDGFYNSTIEKYISKAQANDIRLSYVSRVSAEDAKQYALAYDEGYSSEDLGLEGIRPYEETVQIYPLQPEHYEWDGSEGRSYFDKVKDSIIPVSGGTGKESEELENVGFEEVKETKEEIKEHEEVEEGDLSKKDLETIVDQYGPLYHQAVSSILNNYRDMFTAAYQLETPIGIFSVKDNGNPVIYKISGSKRLEANTGILPMYRYLYEATISSMNLKVMKSRSAKEIASIVVNGHSSDGLDSAGSEDRLYFPNKMLEYAYGLKMAGIGENGATNYPPHDSATSWSNYERVVKSSLDSAFSETIRVLAKRKASEGYSLEDILMDGTISSEIKSYIERLRGSFLTCIMVSDLIKEQGVLALFKLKILYPYGDLDTNFNIATQVAEKAYGKADSDKALSRDVEVKDCYYLHSYEADSDMVAASPLFAYKAAESILKSGRAIKYKSMILGRDISGNIMQNGGSGITLTNSLIHYTIAESRSGKGVEGLSKLANAIRSGKFIFYLDDKPDMASLLLQLSDDAFAINGSAIGYSPSGGTNLQKRFFDKDYAKWENSQGIPSYLKNLFGNTSHKNLSDIYYMRGVLFVMSILYARAVLNLSKDPIFSEGGDESGVVAFFDEWTAINDSLGSKLNSLLGKGVRTTIDSDYNAFKEKEREANENGKPFNKIFAKPPIENFYAKDLIDSLKKSSGDISYGRIAGLKNEEVKVSDIFIIGQEPPILTEELEDNKIYPESNKSMDTFMSGASVMRRSPLAPFVAAGSQDILVGNNQSGWLGSSQGGYASNFLNPKNRMFGYIPQFTPDNIDKVFSNDSEWGRKNATFYKPFLILPDHDTNKYYAQNALGYAHSVGVSASSIISQNAELDENGEKVVVEPYTINFTGGGSETIETGYKLNEAVGLEGYLKYIGLTEDEVKNNVDKSSRLAQKIMERIGYSGTWRQFIMDLRPEYMFTVESLAECMSKGTNLASLHTTNGSLLYKYYPEAFTVDVDNSSNSFESIGEGNYSDFSDDSSEGFSSEDLASSHYMNEGSLPVDELDELNKSDDLMDDIDLNKEQDVYQNEQAIRFSNQDRLKDLTLEQIQQLSPSEQELILRSLLDSLKGEPTITNPNDKELGYGKLGVAYDESGRAYRIDTSQVDLTSSKYDEVVLDNNMADLNGSVVEVTYPALVKTVTQKALATAKQQGGIKSISVIGGSLVVNEVMIGLKIAENLLKGLPSVVADNIRSGRLAEYFNWKLLPRCGVVRLQVDSSRFVFSKLSESIGYGTNFNVQELFEDVRSLQKFVVGSKEYTRSSVKEFGYGSQDEFYQPRRSEQAYRLSQAWLHKKRINTWQYSRDVWKRKDLGTFRKTVYSAAGAVGAGVSGATQVTGWTGRKLFRGIGKAAKSFKDMIEESNNLSK